MAGEEDGGAMFKSFHHSLVRGGGGEGTGERGGGEGEGRGRGRGERGGSRGRKLH